MTTPTGTSGGGIIFFSFVAALFLTIVPLPAWAGELRPEWVALFLIYWCMALPQRVGVGTAWIVGLFLDVLRGALLGQHALALTVTAYLSIKLHQRIRVYPVWQQALSVLVLVTLYQLLVLWISGTIGKPASRWTYWLPSLTSTLTWPFVYVVLRSLRQSFRVS